jgi:hypothetical protein
LTTPLVAWRFLYKESPLWDTASPIIYWWTSTENGLSVDMSGVDGTTLIHSAENRPDWRWRLL